MQGGGTVKRGPAASQVNTQEGRRWECVHHTATCTCTSGTKAVTRLAHAHALRMASTQHTKCSRSTLNGTLLLALPTTRCQRLPVTVAAGQVLDTHDGMAPLAFAAVLAYTHCAQVLTCRHQHWQFGTAVHPYVTGSLAATQPLHIRSPNRGSPVVIVHTL